MGDETATTTPPDGWPECDSEQVAVMLLGTYHMANPGNDEVNVDADDVLSSERQAELEDLTDRLADWRPDRIGLEWPHECHEGVNALYDEYRTGERSYDRSEEIEPLREYPAETDASCRSEAVQIGFRLADALDHEQVYPIDDPMDISNGDLDSLEKRDFEPERKVEFTLPDLESSKREADDQLANSTIPEFLAWQNRESQLRLNHDWMFAKGVRWGEGDNFGGPRWLAAWYDRNLRMVHNLWRAVEAGDERTLMLVGSGHVRALRHLLEEAPMFRPVSPLASLP